MAKEKEDRNRGLGRIEFSNGIRRWPRTHHGTQYLNQRFEEKKQKYQRLIKKELNQAEYTTGEVIFLVIGALGTITEITNTNLKKLWLTKHREALQMTVIKGSANILNTHLKTTDDKPTRKRQKAVRYYIRQTANWWVTSTYRRIQMCDIKQVRTKM